MENAELRKQVRQFEQEIAQLKAQLEPPRPRYQLTQRSYSTFRFFASNWVFLSFIVAILTAIYVNFAFGVDYFESYRNISTTKQLSEFYRELGDDLLERQEWLAAENAYRTAVDINPNNLEATYGIAKAEVFRPLEGERYAAPEIVKIRLNYLLERFPEDYQLLYLRGVQYLIQGDNDNARVWFNRSLEERPDFAAAYLSLGFISMRAFDLEAAVQNTMRALELDPENAVVYINLGHIYMIQGEFNQAGENLAKANSLSPTLLAQLNLGNVYRYVGDYRSALQWHLFALNAMSQPGIENERYVTAGGTWLYNFMPLNSGDLETIRYYVTVDTVSYKRMFLHYALSFDYALIGEFENAEREFETAYQLDSVRMYDAYFSYNIQSLENFLNVDGEVKTWFEEHRARLGTL